MTCIEAIACGCVPIVSDSAKSATSQFAANKNSVFHSGDYCDLADKIDWWIEHPIELSNNRQAVAEHSQNFTIERSMGLYIAMFERAIADWKQAHEIQAKNDEYDEFMEGFCTKDKRSMKHILT